MLKNAKPNTKQNSHYTQKKKKYITYILKFFEAKNKIIIQIYKSFSK